MSRSLPLSITLALLLPASAAAEDAWMQRSMDALRWPDAEQVSTQLEEGAQVTVVYRAEGMVRVRSGADFGWVPEDALLDADPGPAAEASDPWDIPEVPSLEIPGLGKAPRVEPKLDAAPAAPTAPAPEAPASE
jgi:hypothetical protein